MTSAFDHSHEHAGAEVVDLPRFEPVPDMSVPTLGPARITSPMEPLLNARRTTEHYVHEDDRVLLDDTVAGVASREVPAADLPGMEPCGPRRKAHAG